MNILFLCTGNSCRSQMAEGFARALGADGLTVASAGIEAHGLNPRAVAAMAEDGIDISGQVSTRVTDAMLAGVDRVVTVCGDADEQCPILPPDTSRVHWPLPDPTRVTGTDEEISAAFRRVRDELRERVEALLAGVDA
ncbi:arsenate reductase (thioredoxin) [Aquisalimonas lutea]|uniref:arsenate reductase (thioredoxin) n=1 Tax=Aquisalimonas lutea TaxID=1327750 RepID=UPI0025B53AB7|nr:arsenate reductase (thioredoxin) [Aquisalimonas lutea]MDN3517781.1 arsenate reductase (thioredoxin) [Aquisalimonas lutea]